MPTWGKLTQTFPHSDIVGFGKCYSSLHGSGVELAWVKLSPIAAHCCLHIRYLCCDIRYLPAVGVSHSIPTTVPSPPLWGSAGAHKRDQKPCRVPTSCPGKPQHSSLLLSAF